MTEPAAVTLPQPGEVTCTWGDVFPGQTEPGPFIKISLLDHPVHYFVGRNGSGKTRTALAIKRFLETAIGDRRLACRYLRSDRLFSFQNVGHYGGGFFGPSDEFKGVPLDHQGVSAGQNLSDAHGMASDAFYVLRDHPDIRLRVISLLRRAFGRTLSLTEKSGLLDPQMSLGRASYSLLRGEGHGLQELVVLFTTILRRDWNVLIVDEPELHLHPAATTILISELLAECVSSARHAIVISHEPRLLSVRSATDLDTVWLFRPKHGAISIGSAVLPIQKEQVASDLAQNASLVSDLVFSACPVLVEGERDVAALTSTLQRLHPPIAAAQTDFIRCGGTSAIARWTEIGRGLDLEMKAVADLDALFEPSFSRTLDASKQVQDAYMDQWQVKTTSEVLKPLYAAMNSASVGTDPASRRRWLLSVLQARRPEEEPLRIRIRKVLDFWRSAGVWLHPEGDLEATMGLSKKSDIATYRQKAKVPNDLDACARWAALLLPDERTEIQNLLQVEVERIANEIQRNVKLDSDVQATTPMGETSASDARLVEVLPLGDGKHRISVKLPVEFHGWYVTFDRSTSPNALALRQPDKGGDG